MTYTPGTNFVGQDRFNYTLSDGGCGLAQGIVLVTVISSNTPPLNVISITMSGANFALQFVGVPGQAYVIQSAPAVTGPWADLSGSLTADPSGLITYTVYGPLPSAQYYRTRVGP